MKLFAATWLIFTYLLQNSVIAYAQHPFDCEDKSYNDNVQTVLLYPIGEPLAYPIINLNDGKLLQLRFDVLGDMAYIYNYTLIHCTYDWKPSRLQPREYIEGYTDDRISNYSFSVNTLTPYVHHSLQFPTANLKPKISGNFLLVVYSDQLKTGNVLLTKRFMVADPKVSISAKVAQSPRNPDYAFTKQQLDVEVIGSNFFANHPSNAFQLVIRQNSRWDNAVVGLKPSHTYNSKLNYEYIEETVFEGGNQWRNFDMKSFKYQSERIQRIEVGNNSYKVELWEDAPRQGKVLQSETDIFGNKLIQARKDQDTDTEGDYALVTFFLNYNAPLTHGEMYVIGALNDWKLNEKNKMKYNFGRKGYALTMFLKQGYYNYLYGILEKGNKASEVGLVEGNHRDTRNEYLLLFYFQQPGTSYDQLIASNVIRSN